MPAEAEPAIIATIINVKPFIFTSYEQNEAGYKRVKVFIANGSSSFIHLCVVFVKNDKNAKI